METKLLQILTVVAPVLISAFVSILGYIYSRKKVSSEAELNRVDAAGRNVEVAMALVNTLQERIESLEESDKELRELHKSNQKRIRSLENGVRSLQQQIEDLGHSPVYKL